MREIPSNLDNDKASPYGASDASFSIPRKPLPQTKADVLEMREMHGPDSSTEDTPALWAVAKQKKPFLYFWWLEIACCTLATAMLLTTVAVLYPRQELPLPRWPYSVTINALIAVLAVIMKAAILLVIAEGLGQLKYSWFQRHHPIFDLEIYDMASRGPWGSLYLVWMLRHRHVVATIGAVVTILALAIDPFTQQILHYYPCSVIDNTANASVPRTGNYQVMGYHINTIFNTVSVGMQSAISAGLYSEEPPKVPVTCSTGNCTFPEVYETVGVCNDCSDITSQLTTYILNMTSNETTTYLNGSNPGVNLYSLVEVNATLPSGLYAIYNYDQSVDYNGNYAWLIMRPNYTQGLSPNASIELIFTHSLTNYNATPWAAKCNLYPCVKSYTSEVHNGDFSETPVGEPFRIPATGDLQSAVNVQCISSQQRQYLTDHGYSIDEDTKWINWNHTSGQDPMCSSASGCNETTLGSDRPDQIPMECMFTFSYFSWNAMLSFLAQYFNGSITPTGSAFEGPSVLQTIFDDGDVTYEKVTSRFANVAEAMTTNIRENGNVNWSQPVVGVARRQDTCVHVRWGWFAFSAVLVLLTILFLAVTIIDSCSQNISPDWKSSLLPILMHGLEHDVIAQQMSDEPLNMRNLQRTTRTTNVQLQESREGFKFVKIE